MDDGNERYFIVLFWVGSDKWLIKFTPEYIYYNITNALWPIVLNISVGFLTLSFGGGKYINHPTY